jgi:hypothetical protein
MIAPIALSELTPGSKQYEFVEEINASIEHLNHYIEQYNASTSRDLLLDIEQFKQNIERKYPAKCYSQCEDYIRNIQNKLSTELQEGFLASGIERDAPNELAGLIRDISPQQLSYLHQFLRQENLDLIKQYINEEKLPEAFRHYDVSVLSKGNNDVYQFTHVGTNTSYVLTIGNRLNQPLDIANKLGEQTSYVINPDASRQFSYLSNHSSFVTQNISVLPYYPEGSLLGYRKSLQDNNANYMEMITQIVETALSLYTDMAVLFLDLQQRQIAFPDAKNANFIINNDYDKNKKNRLVITDTKSFFPVDEQLNFQNDRPGNKWYRVLSTTFYKPPEHPKLNPGDYLSTDISHVLKPMNADSLHVFILGRNLYQFLANVRSHYFQHKYDVKSYDFDRSVFTKSPKGHQLAQLIKQMLEPDAEKRIKLVDVINQLNSIRLNLNIEDIKKINEDKLAELSTQFTQLLRIHEMSESTLISAYLAQKKAINNSQNSLSILNQLGSELESYLSGSNQLKLLDPRFAIIKTIDEMIYDYSTNSDIVAYFFEKREFVRTGQPTSAELEQLNVKLTSYVNNPELLKSIDLQYKAINKLDKLSKRHSSPVMLTYINNKRSLVKAKTLNFSGLMALNTELQSYIDRPRWFYFKQSVSQLVHKKTPEPPEQPSVSKIRPNDY